MYPSYTEWVYHKEIVNLYRGIERLDEGTSNDSFHEETSNDPFHIKGTHSNLFHEDNEMLEMLNDLQDSIEHDKEIMEETDLENDMSFNSGVEEETTNIFQELLNQARCELYPGCSEFSSLNFLVN